MGIPITERAARTNEALRVLKQGWAGGPLTFKGRFHDLERITFEPTVQKPHVPIWIAGRREGAMRRAGRYGDRWLPYLYTPEMLASSMAVVGAAAEGAGRAASDVTGAVLAYFSVGSDRAAARRDAIDYMSATYKRDFTGLVDRYVIHGTPADAQAALRAYHDAGARTVLGILACPPEHADAMRQVLVSDVFPEFRQ
jgi:alkanesulfonate monooxygenase SsuD/methylene tetrahydromethanopterin reductase-like flavin-dependent oxidoreductase (luciferase family)